MSEQHPPALEGEGGAGLGAGPEQPAAHRPSGSSDGTAVRLPIWTAVQSGARNHWLLLASLAGFVLFVGKLLAVSNGSIETATVLLSESVSLQVLVWMFARLFPFLLPFALIALVAIALFERGPWYLWLGAGVILFFAIGITDAPALVGMLVVLAIGAVVFVKFLRPAMEREDTREGASPWPIRPMRLVLILSMAIVFFDVPQFYLNSDDLWLVPERIELSDGSERVAFIAGSRDGWFTLLIDRDRSIEYVPADDVVRRAICRTKVRAFFVPWWDQSVVGWLAGHPRAELPPCSDPSAPAEPPPGPGPSSHAEATPQSPSPMATAQPSI